MIRTFGIYYSPRNNYTGYKQFRHVSILGYLRAAGNNINGLKKWVKRINMLKVMEPSSIFKRGYKY